LSELGTVVRTGFRSARQSSRRQLGGDTHSRKHLSEQSGRKIRAAAQLSRQVRDYYMKKPEAAVLLSNIAATALILPIRAYQKTRFLRRRSCRFYPTCSEYAVQSVQRFGSVYGFALALLRICKCHPWNDGGVDMVPEQRKNLSILRWFSPKKLHEQMQR
jgi:uncharacterized protein